MAGRLNQMGVLLAPSRCEHGRYLGKTATFKTKSISGVRKEDLGAFAAEETRNQCGRSKDPRAAPGKTGDLLLRADVQLVLRCR